MEKFICCLCNKEIEGYGNDPHPLETKNEDDECCDECNLAKVVPARMGIYLNPKKEKLQEKHEELRNILIKYGCQEHGDVIIDDICSLFDYPQTTVYYKED